MPDLQLNSPLQYVKGVGPRKAEVLAQHGLKVIRDLLLYFPRQYLDRTSVIPISQVKIDEPVTVIGRVKAHGVLHGKRKRYEVILEDETGAISLLWFQGVRYWERVFEKGQVYAATGTIGYFRGHQMVHPDLERLEDDSDRMIHAGRIIPVYPQTSELNKVGLNSKGMRRVTTYIFDNLSEQFRDPLPEAETEKLGLVGLHTAVSKIHYPDSREQVETCRRRLAFDELLAFQFRVFRNKLRKEQAVKKHRYAPPAERMKKFKELLPFKFTTGQARSLGEIFADMQQSRPMSRLLQGDVGCGKTVVAIAAVLYAAENNLQAAFMAPTEILAEQHYRNWKPILEELGVESGFLSSSLKASQKKKVAEECAAGAIRVLFGTHALIYDYVVFERLGLVVIDEQHRFGVEQRGKLYDKGENPDLLVMTATPIPRTLALTLYGDLDISTIDTMPPGRKPIRTVWRAHNVRDKVYKFVCDEIARGGQAYIIYPLIEKSDRVELENVEDAYEELSGGPFRDLKVGMVHGRVKPKERDEILARFRDGDLKVLLATTVIEVGIDNPNATVMVVEHAERFGLAQLHQLRGRIGRGTKQATLVALAHPPISDIGRQRLQFLVGTNDGFEIAEADLELRGPGEVFGVRQSGVPELKAVRLSKDRDLLEATRDLLQRLFHDRDRLDGPHEKLLRHLTAAVKAAGPSPGGG